MLSHRCTCWIYHQSNILEIFMNDVHPKHFAGKFNQLVYQYPIRIPERFSLVIRSLLTQEGICFTLEPDFKFLEVTILNFNFYLHLLLYKRVFLWNSHIEIIFSTATCFIFLCVFRILDLRHLSIGSNFLQVAYPYVAKRLLTDPNPALRERLIQVNPPHTLPSSL